MKASVIVAAFLAGLICGVAMSGRTADWAVATVRSYHMERGKGYEEANYGLGLERHLSDRLRISTGVYRNSERSDSVYGAAVWCPSYLRFANWRGCGMAGGVTGYSSPLSPLLGAVLSYEGKVWGMNLILFPNGKGDPSQGVIGFQVKHRW